MKYGRSVATGVIFTVILMLVSPAVHAWNGTGHQLVAGVAWDNMTPEARQMAIELLEQAPETACLRDLFPNDSRPREVQEREFFMRVATWPDVIRPRGSNDPRRCTRFHQREWHFIDHFWQGFSDGTGSRAPRDRTDIEIPEVNATERLRVFEESVPCADGPCVSARRRAMQLGWILHLVGDIHQPLHTAARVTPNHPDGDAGGNSFPLEGEFSQLHSYWDNIVDTAVLREAGEFGDRRNIIYLDRVIEMIVSDHPRANMTDRIKPRDFDAWALEGFETTKTRLYPLSLQINEEPSNIYRDMAFGIASERIALGGYRLADLLNQILAP